MVGKNQQWVPTQAPASLRGFSFKKSTLTQSGGQTRFKAGKTFYLAASSCLVPAPEGQEKQTGGSHLIGIALDHFNQGMTAKGSDGNAYPLIGKFTGIAVGLYPSAGFRVKDQFIFGVSAEAFAGFTSVTEDASGTPTPIFTYSAKNYPELGLRALAEVDYSKSRWMFSLLLGGGLSWVSLPAPQAAISISAPSSIRFFLNERLLIHYLLNPDMGIFTGAGALGGFSNLELVLGLKFMR